MNRFYVFSILLFPLSVVALAQDLKVIPAAFIAEGFLETLSDASSNIRRIEEEAQRRGNCYHASFLAKKKSYSEVMRERRHRIRSLLRKISELGSALLPVWRNLARDPAIELAELLALGALPETEHSDSSWNQDDFGPKNILSVQKHIQSENLQVPGLWKLPGPESSPSQPRASDGSEVSLDKHFRATESARISTGSSANTADFRTPEFYVSLKPIEKFRRAVSNTIAIVKNARDIRRRGFPPLLLQESTWIEVCGPDHYFISDRDGAAAVMHWKMSGRESFQEECRVGTQFQEWSRAASSLQYLQPHQRGEYRVRIGRSEEGIAVLLTANGYLLNSQELIFVMDSCGTLYVAKPQLRLFHHSSIFSGGAVLWAGELKTNKNGEISYLSNESGHYKPQKIHNLNGLRELQRQGFDLNKVIFQEFSENCTTLQEPKYNALEYLESGNSEFDY